MAAMAHPKVSGVLVTYNRAGVLRDTLSSLLAQSFHDFELIVSDDCSTDGTAEVCAEFQRRDPRIRYRCNARNLRMPGNLEAGIREARGEYIAILHDGDVYREDLLEKWSAALDRYPRAAFVFNAYRVWRGGGWHVDRIDMPPCLEGREFLRRVFIPNWGGSPVFGTTMVRRSCLEAAGPFDPAWSMQSDIEMWVRLASHWDVAYVPEPLMTLMPHEEGHFLDAHYWWNRTVDVRAKRRAHRVVYGNAPVAALRFELRARLYYLRCILPHLKHRRFADVRRGLKIVATGRDVVQPPY